MRQITCVLFGQIKQISYLCIRFPMKRKAQMVDIVQLVRTSDCGSECRGFESPYPPNKAETSGRHGFPPSFIVRLKVANEPFAMRQQPITSLQTQNYVKRKAFVSRTFVYVWQTYYLCIRFADAPSSGRKRQRQQRRASLARPAPFESSRAGTQQRQKVVAARCK